MSKNLSELSGKKGLKYNLFDKMGELAIDTGTPSVKDLDRLADEFLMGKANTYGTATFYDFLKPENKGKKVYVCNGTACLCAGTQENVNTSLSAHFSEDEIGHMTCLGRCHENSAFHYNGKNYSGDAIQKLDHIVESNNGLALNKDKYNVKANGEVILTESFSDIQEYYEPLRRAILKGSEWALEEIKTSNLRGRGGAGFGCAVGCFQPRCQHRQFRLQLRVLGRQHGMAGAQQVQSARSSRIGVCTSVHLRLRQDLALGGQLALASLGRQQLRIVIDIGGSHPRRRVAFLRPWVRFGIDPRDELGCALLGGHTFGAMHDRHSQRDQHGQRKRFERHNEALRSAADNAPA